MTYFALTQSKILHKWNDHLEIFSRPQMIENARWVLLKKFRILRQREMWLPDRGLHTGFAPQARV